MKISLTDDDGVLLDEVRLTVEEWREELRRHPFGLLAHLQPGDLSEVDMCRHVKTKLTGWVEWCQECGDQGVVPGVPTRRM